MMFDKSLFIYYVMRRNLTLKAIAKKLQVDPATLTRKMAGLSGDRGRAGKGTRGGVERGD